MKESLKGEPKLIFVSSFQRPMKKKKTKFENHMTTIVAIHSVGSEAIE